MTEPNETPLETVPAADPTPGAIAALQQWFDAVRVMLARLANIAVMEARLATINLVLILIIAIACGLLLASAWIALFAAVVVWLNTLGLSWPAALALIAVVNLAAVVAGAYVVYRLSNNLLLRTLRTFLLASENKTNDAVQPAAGQTPSA